MIRLCLAGLVGHCLIGAVTLPHVSIAAIDQPIVVTELPASGNDSRANDRSSGLLRESYGEGGRLVIVNPDGTKRMLAESFHSVCDPDVSFDGKRLLLAGKKTAQDHWNIYEIGVDGSGLRQITQGMGDCRSPSYQSAFYQISDANEAWYQITFVCSRAGRVERIRLRAGNGLVLVPARWHRSAAADVQSVQRLRSAPDVGRTAGVRQLAAAHAGARAAGTRGSAGSQSGRHRPGAAVRGQRKANQAHALRHDGRAGRVCGDGPRAVGRSGDAVLRDDPPSAAHVPADHDCRRTGCSIRRRRCRTARILVSRRPADGSGTHGVYRFDPVSKRIGSRV